MKSSTNLENKIPSDTYVKAQLLCMKIQALLLKTTTGIQSVPDAINESRLIMTFLTNVGVTGIICSFRLVQEEKAGSELPESSRLEFSEKYSATNFALSNTKDNTS